MIRRIPALALAALAMAALISVACGSGNSSSTTPSPATSTSGETPTSSTTPAACCAIRTMDLEHASQVQQLIRDTGGEFVATQVMYGDLTGDGIDEAVVPISSGGTLGDLTYAVLSPTADGIVALLVEKVDTPAGSVAVDISGGKLVDTRPEYGPNDPECCPSLLRKTTYTWTGARFAIGSTETIPNPTGGVKGTPSGGTPPANPTSAGH